MFNFVTNIDGCIDSATQMMNGNLNLIYYSHVPVLIIALLLGLFVISNNKSASAKAFFALTVVYSLWIISSLITWVSSSSVSIMFFWSLFGIIDASIFLTSLFLVYSYSSNRDLPIILKTFLLVIFLPIILLTPTIYNLKSFDFSYCSANDNLFFNYTAILKIIITLLIIAIAIYKYIKIDVTKKKEFLLFSVGIALFLTSIFGSEYISDNYEMYIVSVFGVFVVTLFMAFMAYLIVRFKAFDIKLIATQALVVGLVILIGSQFFFTESNLNRILVSITLVIAGSMGIAIVRSVKKEIALKEELEVANTNQQSLIHFISHQLKGFFTKSKMIFAGIIEEDFGQTSPILKEVASEGLKSDDNAVSMIQNILGASNLRKGTTTYEMKSIDLSQIVKKASDAYKMEIEAKGLKLIADIDNNPIMINADEKQISQVIRNLIDNSLKYTPTGFIKIFLKTIQDGKKQKALFKLEDSGVGLSEDDKHKLFTEGGRGIDSVKINVNSTGYGLFIVKQIVENHNGRIWAESEGRGKGSRFFVEMDLVK